MRVPVEKSGDIDEKWGKSAMVERIRKNRQISH